MGEWYCRELWYLLCDMKKKILCKGFIEYLMIEFSYYIKWYYIVGFFVFMIFVIGYEVNGSYVRFV